MAANKNNKVDGKSPLKYLDFAMIDEMCRVFEFGATKYGKNNFYLGHEVSTLLEACIRHLLAYKEGEDNDPESGLNHIAHAQCNLAMLMQQLALGTSIDDRVTLEDVRAEAATKKSEEPKKPLASANAGSIDTSNYDFVAARSLSLGRAKKVKLLGVVNHVSLAEICNSGEIGSLIVIKNNPYDVVEEWELSFPSLGKFTLYKDEYYLGGEFRFGGNTRIQLGEVRDE